MEKYRDDPDWQELDHCEGNLIRKDLIFELKKSLMELANRKVFEFAQPDNSSDGEFYPYHRPLYLAGENTLVNFIMHRMSELALTPFMDELQEFFLKELFRCPDPCTSKYNEGDIFKVWSSDANADWQDWRGLSWSDQVVFWCVITDSHMELDYQKGPEFARKAEIYFYDRTSELSPTLEDEA